MIIGVALKVNYIVVLSKSSLDSFLDSLGNELDKYKHFIDYKINNLALFLKKIRLLKEA